jgi:tRNA-intron lyase
LLSLISGLSIEHREWSMISRSVFASEPVINSITDREMISIEPLKQKPLMIDLNGRQMARREKSGLGGGKFTPADPLPQTDIIRYGPLFVIPGSSANRDLYFQHFAFGAFVGDLLVLSPFEVFFLRMVRADVDLPLSTEALWQHCSSLFAPTCFAKCYAVYHYYRCNLWVVRDGSAFGGQFVLYQDHPDVVHSKFIVNIVDDWSSRDRVTVLASRIGWSVKKATILVRVVVPKDADFGTPDCLRLFAIEDVSIKRVKFK